MQESTAIKKLHREIKSTSYKQVFITMPKVLVLCPDENAPIGGIRVLYRHVDILNKNSISASILHLKKDFRCTWFQNSTSIVTYKDCSTIEECDVLVLPEIYGTNMHNEVILQKKNFLGIRKNITLDVRHVKKVIFNQNAHYTFDHYPHEISHRTSPYLQPDVLATIVVSEHSRHYIQSVFPEHRVHRIRLGCDESIFYYSKDKKKQIAFMPRKHPMDITRVINTLKFKGALDGWQLVPIEGKTERQVGELLRESSIFMSFGSQEGFQLPPAEAMACGCIAVGYHGYGGKEFMEQDFAYPVPVHDIVSFAEVMEQVLQQFESNPLQMQLMGKQASEYMLANHTYAHEEADVMALWNTLL